MARYLVRAVLLILLASQGAACEIALAYNIEPSPPYMMGEEGLQQGKPGVAVELLQRAASKINCTLKLSRLPNVRVLAETGAGKHDGAFMYSYNAERAASLVYPMRDGKPDPTRRITSLSYYLYRLKGSTVEWDGQRITGLSGAVGVNLGWSIGKDLRASGIAIEEAINTRQNLEKLRSGRIAAYATQDLIADAAIQRLGFQNIERLPLMLSTKHYFLVFNLDYYEKNHALADRLWDAIATLRDSTLNSLLPQYDID